MSRLSNYHDNIHSYEYPEACVDHMSSDEFTGFMRYLSWLGQRQRREQLEKYKGEQSSESKRTYCKRE